MCEDLCTIVANEDLSLQDFTAANQAVVADPPAVLTRRGAFGYAALQTIAFGSLFIKDSLKDQLNDTLLGGDRKK